MNESGLAPFGITLLVKNQYGIKELYKVISSIKYDGVCSLIDLDVLKKNRKNLLVGSCGNMGELYDAIAKNEDTEKTGAFYDYFEIYPTKDKTEKDIYKKIFDLGGELGVPVIATGNCHYISSADAICRDIVINARNLKNSDNGELYVRTTKEMLEEFSYLGNYGAEKVVVVNPKILTAIIDEFVPLKEGNYYPIFENAYSNLEKICYSKAYELYGNPLPKKIKERLDTELGFLKDEQAASQYLLAKKLADYAKEKGQLTTTRGAVGSTLVTFFLGVGNTNPLSPHYYCDCHYFEFSELADDGFDLPDKVCPACKKKLKTDGHNIPFETFMGLTGDKIPDIDLNFPDEFVLDVHEYLCKYFGENKVVQAGIVSTIWEGSAEWERIAEKYEMVKNLNFKAAEKENLINKIAGIKRFDGVHPVGVMVIPKDMEIEDFTPLNQNFVLCCTTHFDFHNLHDTILKQDILRDSTLDLLLELEKKTGKTVNDIKWNDPLIYNIFQKADTLCIPGFDTDFIRDMLIKTKPENFNDLVKFLGLCHGTNVWMDNAEHLIKNKICSISEVIATRDDIFVYLISKGMDRATAFRIMESVRKGLWAKQKLSDCDKKFFVEKMKSINVPDWYIDSLTKIRYMFPKAHAVANVINAVRLMWFKIYYPKEFEFLIDTVG